MTNLVTEVTNTIFESMGHNLNVKSDLDRYLDEAGRLKLWPSKRNRSAVQGQALEMLASKFETDTQYTEKQVNETLRKWHTFDDHALLRRELVTRCFLNRKADGSCYWKTITEEQP